MPRALLDANVLVSGLISSGPPAALLAAWLAKSFELVASPSLLEELDEVLRRPKFRRYLTESDVDEFLTTIRGQAWLTNDPTEVEPGLTPDPRDDYLVALARSARVDYLVSGDADLTGLPDPHPPVLTPQAFLDTLTRA